MKKLIKRNPRLFGLILLLGIVCGVYLASFAVGHLIHMAMPADPRTAEHPIFYQFFERPIAGIFVSCVLVLVCYIAVIIGYLIKSLFEGTWHSINGLGQWLVRKTSGGSQEG